MSDKINKLLNCAALVTQLATIKGKNATGVATHNATVDLKALALKELKRNKERNQTATTEKKERNFNATKSSNELRKENCKKCLHNDELQYHGSGCVTKIKGKYKYQWSLLDTLESCPLGYWN